MCFLPDLDLTPKAYCRPTKECWLLMEDDGVERMFGRPTKPRR